MKIYYDKDTDSAYIELSTSKPDGAIEISVGVNLDTTVDDKIVGIEILNASRKISLKALLQLELDDQLLALKNVS